MLTVVDGHALITGGPYKVVRHPMYAGGVLIAIGAALAVDHRWASATWALPVMALVRRVGVEEAMLREALGTTYTDYARSRARLVPGVW